MNRFYCNKMLVFILFIGTGCTKTYYQFKDQYQSEIQSAEPDYGILSYWAAHPWKNDPADSIPKPIRKGALKDSSVDVFFIHPTTYTDLKRPFGWNAPINNADINLKTDYSSILFQASIFNEAGRIFSPRYRQANLSAYFPKDRSDTLKALSAFELAYEDIKSAFQYYLGHYNNGRPIIIASHSQGTTHSKRLLKEFFDNSVLNKQLVVAYLVGMPVETNYFSTLKACINPWQTGCICSWRTFKEGYQPPYVNQETFTAIVTNPITWDTSRPTAERALNKGGFLLNFNKKVKNVSNALIQGNVLWTKKPHFFGNIFYTSKNYHIADLNLFYLNIRENAAVRKQAFNSK